VKLGIVVEIHIELTKVVVDDRTTCTPALKLYCQVDYYDLTNLTDTLIPNIAGSSSMIHR
jgi:hypothetical protein